MVEGGGRPREPAVEKAPRGNKTVERKGAVSNVGCNPGWNPPPNTWFAYNSDDFTSTVNVMSVMGAGPGTGGDRAGSGFVPLRTSQKEGVAQKRSLATTTPAYRCQGKRHYGECKSIRSSPTRSGPLTPAQYGISPTTCGLGPPEMTLFIVVAACPLASATRITANVRLSPPGRHPPSI